MSQCYKYGSQHGNNHCQCRHLLVALVTAILLAAGEASFIHLPFELKSSALVMHVHQGTVPYYQL